MSLATRCTSCGTVFRVVQDQLKVSEGWVRCGRCDAVFNALEGLFDLDRDAPPEWSDSIAVSPRPTVDVEVDAPADDAAEGRVDGASLVDRIDEQIFGQQRRSAFGTLGGLVRDRAEPDFADARFDSHSADDSDSPDLTIDADAVNRADVAVEEAAPDFVREADRKNRWHGSRARKLLGATTLLLTLGLVAQVAHHHRDEIAARWPAARASLQQWCDVVGCVVGAPRHIEDIVVESTSLSRGTGADAFRLTVVLRNRTAFPVALPWLELSLTDANGELVARRALSPADLRAPTASIAGAGESTLLAHIAAGSSHITGYTVEVFYP